jgi:hypothetical protein
VRPVLDGAHHLDLLEADAAVVGMTPSGPVAAEDVRDLQSWAGHAGPLRRGRSDYSLWYERRQPIQRAHDFANEVGGHLGVARCRVELGMPERTRAIMLTFYAIETEGSVAKDPMLAGAARAFRDTRPSLQP